MYRSAHGDAEYERTAVKRFKRLLEELQQVENGQDVDVEQHIDSGVIRVPPVPPITRGPSKKALSGSVVAWEGDKVDLSRQHFVFEEPSEVTIADRDGDDDTNTSTVHTADVEGILSFLEGQQQDDEEIFDTEAVETHRPPSVSIPKQVSSRRQESTRAVFHDGITKSSNMSTTEASNITGTIIDTSSTTKRLMFKFLAALALVALGMVLVSSIVLWKRNDTGSAATSTSNTDTAVEATPIDSDDQDPVVLPPSPVPVTSVTAAPSPAPTTTDATAFVQPDPTCPVTDVEWTAMVNVRFNGTTAGLTTRELQRLGLAMAVDTSYRIANVISCDQPYYRSARAVQLSLPTYNTNADIVQVQFTMEARRDEQGQGPQTAFDWTNNQTSTRQRRQLKEETEEEEQHQHHRRVVSSVVVSSLSTPPCLLRNVLVGPWQLDCAAAAPNNCACPRDGCYCTSAQVAGPSPKEFQNLLNEYISNLRSTRRLYKQRSLQRTDVLLMNLGFVVALEEQDSGFSR